MVYRELLVMKGLIVVGYNASTFVIAIPDNEVMPDHNPHRFTPVDAPMDLSTLSSFCRVSTAIHQEACHILYHDNTFYFNDTLHLAEFLIDIKADKRRSLHSLELRYRGQAPARAFKLLAQCVNLRRFTIFVDAVYTRDRHVNLIKRQGMVDLLKVRGIQHLEVKEVPFAALYGDDLRRPNVWTAFVNSLQVLKQPHTAAELRRRERKDYPERFQRPAAGGTGGGSSTAQQAAAA